MPRRLSAADAVAAFVDAFNAEDLDALAAAVSPAVEIQGRRGLVIGREEARNWARRRPAGELRQHLILDGVRADGHPLVALVRRQWLRDEGEDLADEEELGVLVSLDDAGLISRWQPFDDRAAALRAAGLES